jgi:hypothetical protein
MDGLRFWLGHYFRTISCRAGRPGAILIAPGRNIDFVAGGKKAAFHSEAEPGARRLSLCPL